MSQECDGFFFCLIFARVVYQVVLYHVYLLWLLQFHYLCIHFFDKTFFPLYLLCSQPDCLDDLSYAIMQETTKLVYRVSEDDVTRACNQVGFCLMIPFVFFFFLFFMLNFTYDDCIHCPRYSMNQKLFLHNSVTYDFIRDNLCSTENCHVICLILEVVSFSKLKYSILYVVMNWI